MERAEIVSFGERLAEDLAAAATRHHVKADKHDILDYEAATVRAYVALVARGVPVPENLRASSLLGPWGRSYTWDEAELLRRASEFHREVQALGIASGA